MQMIVENRLSPSALNVLPQAYGVFSNDRRIRKVTSTSGSETNFPHVTIGGGYYTTFALSDTGDSAISGDLILADQQGQPLIASPTDVGAGSSFPVSIAPAGTMFMTLNPLDQGDPLKSGWATVATAGGVLNGVATFHLMSEGTGQATTGVLPSQPMRYATISIGIEYLETTGFICWLNISL